MPEWPILCLAAVSSLAWRGTLRAELAWEQQRLSFQAAVADTDTTARFKFRNNGKTAVVIRSVAASCSCVTAGASKPSFAPGEPGEVVAKFALESRTGAQKMEIAVATDDPGQTPTVLTMDVTIPKLANLEPDPLRWLPGDPMDAKRIRVTTAPGAAFNLVAVTPSDPRISARIEAGTQPGQFDLVVTPRLDAPTLSASLRIETDFPKQHPKTLLAHVQIAR